MKKVNYTKAELETMSAPELRTLIGTKGISRTSKPDLVKLAVKQFSQPEKVEVKKEAPKVKKKESTEIKVNKSDLLRKEIRRRARAQQSLNSGELMEFMKKTHSIEMSRQFVVNVRVRFLTACPELLKA